VGICIGPSIIGRVGKDFGDTPAFIHIAMFDAEKIREVFRHSTGKVMCRWTGPSPRRRTTLVALYPFQKDRLDAIFDEDIVREPPSMLEPRSARKL